MLKEQTDMQLIYAYKNEIRSNQIMIDGNKVIRELKEIFPIFATLAAYQTGMVKQR